MSRTGKWNAVLESDSRQMANVPMKPSNDFVDEIDMNPSAPRRPFWMDPNYIPKEKRESFINDCDTSMEGSSWCIKEVISGAIIERRSRTDFNGWSIVVRTVIRWEEREMAGKRRHVYVKDSVFANPQPSDIKRWEEKNGKFVIRISRRNTRRGRKQRPAKRTH
jgi:hypothetical protein